MRNSSASQPDDRELAGLFSDLIDLAEDYVEVTSFDDGAELATDDDVEGHRRGAFGDFFMANNGKLLRFLVMRAPDRTTAEGLALATWEAFLHAEGWLHRKPLRLLYATANRLLLEEAWRNPNRVDTRGPTRELAIANPIERPRAKNTRRVRTNVDGVQRRLRAVKTYFAGLARAYSGEPRGASGSARIGPQSVRRVSQTTAERFTRAHSRMFIGSVVAAIAATVWLVSLLVLRIQTPLPPPPTVGTGAGAPSLPPGASSLSGLIVVAAAVFVIAWIATIISAIRDQILTETERIMSEYGEMRETDGFLNGLRQASRPEAEVRALHPVPPRD